MAKKLDIACGDVIRCGEPRQLGVIQAIRVIDTAKFVKSFCGDGEDVVLTVVFLDGQSSIWAKKYEIEEAEKAAAKDFLSQMNASQRKTILQSKNEDSE